MSMSYNAKATKCLTVVVAGFLASCMPPAEPAHKAATVVRLKNVQLAMYVIENTNHSSIGAQLALVSGASIQAKWETLLLNNADALGMQPEDIRDLLCQDDWGHLLNVADKTNLPQREASFSLLGSSFDVAVWSSGPNATNEFGNGDDVVWSPPHANK